MRQNQRRVVTGIAFLRNFNGSRRRRMAQHVGERRLLAADKQQREEQGKEGMQEAAHGAAIRTQCERSINLQQQPLQVFAFGKRQIDRMIGGTLQALHDARGALGVERGAGEDLLEQFRADAPGT